MRGGERKMMEGRMEKVEEEKKEEEEEEEEEVNLMHPHNSSNIFSE